MGKTFTSKRDDNECSTVAAILSYGFFKTADCAGILRTMKNIPGAYLTQIRNVIKPQTKLCETASASGNTRDQKN